MLGQQGDIGAPFPQRRDGQWHDVNAIIEILPECPFFDRLAQVLVAGRNDPDVDFDRQRSPDRMHFSFLKSPQKLALHGHRHLPDFIKKESAAVGCLEQSLFGFVRARKGPFHVTEQLAFEQRFRNRAAIDRHKVFARSLAVAMDHARDYLFARSGLSRDTDRRIRIRHPHHLLQQGLHRRAAGDDVVQPVEFLDQYLQPLYLAAHALLSQRLLDGQTQLGIIEGFGQISVGPPLHCFHGVGNAAVRRQNQHRERWMDQ